MFQQTSSTLDLTLCDREPIHIPGSIQPHGLLLIVDAQTELVQGVAGDIEGRLAPNWHGLPVAQLIGQPFDASQIPANEVSILEPVIGQRETFDVSAHRSDGLILIELEPAEVRGRWPCWPC